MMALFLALVAFMVVIVGAVLFISSQGQVSAGNVLSLSSTVPSAVALYGFMSSALGAAPLDFPLIELEQVDGSFFFWQFISGAFLLWLGQELHRES